VPQELKKSLSKTFLAIVCGVRSVPTTLLASSFSTFYVYALRKAFLSWEPDRKEEVGHWLMALNKVMMMMISSMIQRSGSCSPSHLLALDPLAWPMPRYFAYACMMICMLTNKKEQSKLLKGNKIKRRRELAGV
jgi:hypothetical protein